MDRERYDALQDRINHLEVQKADIEAEGGEASSRLRADLSELRALAEETRKAGHRALLEEIQEGDRKARERDVRSRIAREWRRIEDAPPVEPSEIRGRREALGVTQQQLAQFSGVSKGTINRTECGASIPEPLTLRLIAAGLELVENTPRKAV